MWRRAPFPAMKDIVRLREVPLRRNRQSLPVLRVRVILSNIDFAKREDELEGDGAGDA